MVLLLTRLDSSWHWELTRQTKPFNTDKSMLTLAITVNKKPFSRVMLSKKMQFNCALDLTANTIKHLNLATTSKGLNLTTSQFKHLLTRLATEWHCRYNFQVSNLWENVSTSESSVCQLHMFNKKPLGHFKCKALAHSLPCDTTFPLLKGQLEWNYTLSKYWL